MTNIFICFTYDHVKKDFNRTRDKEIGLQMYTGELKSSIMVVKHKIK